MHSLGREPQVPEKQLMNEPLEGATDSEPVSAPEVLPMS
jgi:hypothetical protein